MPPTYFIGWQFDAPPRWGDHWGRDWDQRRSGWDRWDHHKIPLRAPLPTYQRNYSGDKYPTQVEHQKELRQKNYGFQSRDPIVRKQNEHPQNIREQNPEQKNPRTDIQQEKPNQDRQEMNRNNDSQQRANQRNDSSQQAIPPQKDLKVREQNQRQEQRAIQQHEQQQPNQPNQSNQQNQKQKNQSNNPERQPRQEEGQDRGKGRND
jgi:hypothetical protein